jgi:predicted Fe-Mo cluster-binding NifX family protein
MKIGITSQNFRTITSHAGKCRRFMIFTVGEDQSIEETDRLDLPLEMSLHAWDGVGEHPLFELDHLITAGCGDGFIRRMAREGVDVKMTSEADPMAAVQALIDGTLSAGVAKSHE